LAAFIFFIHKNIHNSRASLTLAANLPLLSHISWDLYVNFHRHKFGGGVKTALAVNCH
jgi:hypothetical protein